MRKKLIFFVYILFASGIAILSVMKADYNWDVLPYAGCVIAIETSDANEIHRKTYEIFKESVDSKTYLQLTTGSNYRETLANNADSFNQNLPFYKVKPLYILLMYALYKSGINLFTAPIIISAVFYFFMSILVFIWISKFTENQIHTFLFSALLSFAPFMISFSSSATPDLLSSFLIVLAMFRLLTKKNIYWFLLFMILSILVRPDNIFIFAILTGVLTAIDGFSRYRKMLYAGIAIGVLTEIIVNVWSGNYAYSILFQHLVERSTNPAEMHTTITPGLYLKGLSAWVFIFKYSVVSIQFLILFIALFIRYRNAVDPRKDLEFLVLIALGISIILHYLLFPLMDDRFFIAQYVIIDILFINSVYNLWVKNRQLVPI